MPYNGEEDIDFYKTYNWHIINKLEEDFKIVIGNYFEQFPDSEFIYEPETFSYIPKIPYANISFGIRHKDISVEAAEKLIQLAKVTDSQFEDHKLSYMPREYISAFCMFIKWNHLSLNKNLPWDFALLFQFETLWQFMRLSYNSTAFQHTLKKDLNAEFIAKVMSGIKNSYEDIEKERQEIEMKQKEQYNFYRYVRTKL